MTNPMNQNGDRLGSDPRSDDDLRVGDDLVWTAYQYTADELPEPAARAFEASLETDQRAREALSEAVALGDTIRAALGPEGVSSPQVMPASLVASSAGASGPSSDRNAAYSWTRSVAWVALGAAACLALTMALNTPALRTTPPADAPTSGPIAKVPVGNGPATKSEGQADHQLLAVLWPEGTADLAAGDAGSTPVVGTDATDVAADAESVADDDLIFEPMPDAAAPDWLIAAVAEDGAPANE